MSEKEKKLAADILDIFERLPELPEASAFGGGPRVGHVHQGAKG